MYSPRASIVLVLFAAKISPRASEIPTAAASKPFEVSPWRKLSLIPSFKIGTHATMLNARAKGEVRKIKFPPNARSAKINSFLLGKFLWLAGIIDFSSLKFKAVSCLRIPALSTPASSLRIKEPILALNLASVTPLSLAAAFCSALVSSPLKPATFMRSLV